MSSLVDSLARSLRDLRISVTDRCNFRCPYCMPAEIFGERYQFLPKPEILSFEEIERIARVGVSLGATKLRITGGEPLLRSHLPDLVRRLAAIDGVADLALTTNGSLLAKHAEALAAAGLGRVTISLDALDDEVARRMSGDRHDASSVLAGLAAAERAGLRPIKVNCVVERGVNDGEVLALARHFRGSGHVLRFIEFMDVGNRNAWDRSRVVPSSELVERIGEVFPLRALPPSSPGEVANRWAYVDGGGEIGVISSVTAPFCGSCTRGRLTTDGRFVTCLFAEGGIDLKGPLRAGATDEDLRERIAGRWKRRSDRYSEQRAMSPPGDTARKLEMYEIGG